VPVAKLDKGKLNGRKPKQKNEHPEEIREVTA